MNNPDFLRPETPQEGSQIDMLKTKLESLHDPHDFDIARMGLEDGDIEAISALLDLDESARKFRDPDFAWTPENNERYAQVRGKIHEILQRFTAVPADSDEGMLTAFLRNKLAVVDLAASYAARKAG